MLDTSQLVETPEGVDLEQRVAGPGVRALAWSLDALIRSGIYIGTNILLTMLGSLGVGVFLLVVFLLEWLYPVMFEVWRDGMTPGKKAMGIRVVRDNGTPVDWSASMVRNLLRVVDFFPFAYAAGLASMLLSRDFKRLGDLAAGTVVIYRSNALHNVEVPPRPALPPPVALSLEEQRAILNYAERSARLSPARREELARVLVDLTGARSQEGEEQLYRYANWLQGTEQAQ